MVLFSFALLHTLYLFQRKKEKTSFYSSTIQEKMSSIDAGKNIFHSHYINKTKAQKMRYYVNNRIFLSQNS